jgi:hypothetical protein
MIGDILGAKELSLAKQTLASLLNKRRDTLLKIIVSAQGWQVQILNALVEGVSI